MDFICVSVRIPKSGSSSLSRLLGDAFAGRRTFFMYDTLNPDIGMSRLQAMRYRRSQARNLFRRYRTGDVETVFAKISAEAANGDLIDGGHMDFASVQANVSRPLKMITLMRDPVARSRSEYNYARQSFSNRNIFNRWDTGVLPKVAGRRDFDGFLDFLLAHRDRYGNIASRFIGWDGTSDLAALFEANVFHAGVLEESARFAAGLSEKMGKPLSFPLSNRVESAREITKAQRSKIEQICPLDFTLYEWVRTRR
jgi:hypothetical protein